MARKEYTDFLDILQSRGIIGVVKKENFNQKLFMQLIDELRKKQSMSQKEFCEQVAERKDSVYSLWMSEREKLSVTAVIRICQMFDLSPEWAFDPTHGLSASSTPASFELQSETLALTESERRAFVKWVMMQVEWMPVENPLTIACRKIATQIARDTAPSARQETQDATLASKTTGEKDVPNAKVQRQQAGQKH